MKLYRIVGTGILMGISALLSAQEDIKKYSLHPGDVKLEGRYIVDRDLNERMEYMTDREFNDWPVCYMLDGVFIKSGIGLNQYKVTKKRIEAPFMIKKIGEKEDSVHVDTDYPDSVRIGETTYHEFYDYHSTGDTMKLVSLEDLRKEIFPDVEGPYVYMINKFFIFKDDDLYRLDRKFIYKMEMFYSNEITELKDLPPFAVIRVFTRTEHNRWWQFTGPWDWM